MGAQDYLQQQGTMSGPNAYQQFMSPYQQDVIDATGTARSQIGNAQAQSTAQGALSGPTAYQQFMSPYQQDVIDASMSEFDKQSAKGITGIGQMAAQSGNLGGGREGVMRSEYQSDSDMKRAALTSTDVTTRIWSSTRHKLTQPLVNKDNCLVTNKIYLITNRQNDEQQLFGNEQNMFNNQQQLFSNQNQLMAGANQLGADQQRMASLVPGLYGQDVQRWVKRALTNKHKNKLSLINKEKLTDLQPTNHTKDLVTWVLVWVMLWVVLWVNTLLK